MKKILEWLKATGECKMENVKCKMIGDAWRRIRALLHFTFYTLHFTFAIALAMALAGCSDLRPSAKTQTMSLYAIGIPGIAVVTQSTQDADNRGDDENKPTQANPVTVEVPIK